MLKVPIRLTRITFSKSASGWGPSRPSDAFGDADAGAIDQHPRGPMRRGGFGDRRAGGRFVGDVADDGEAPTALAASSAAAALRSNTATFAPLAASASAVARPSPEPPPVTIAATPERFIALPPSARPGRSSP